MFNYILCASLEAALTESREVSCYKCKTKLALSKASEASWGNDKLFPVCFNCWPQVQNGQSINLPSDLEIKTIADKLSLPFDEVKNILLNIISGGGKNEI